MRFKNEINKIFEKNVKKPHTHGFLSHTSTQKIVHLFRFYDSFITLNKREGSAMIPGSGTSS